MCIIATVMKRSIQQRLSAVCLLAMLLFAQTASGFVHDRHDFHEELQQKQDQPTFHKHGEHCKICNLELFSSLLAPADLQLCTPVFDVIHFETLTAFHQSAPDNLRSGRAPPRA